MRTENQIEASRINGAKSHGPTTEEGKLASSRNAVTHGLAAAATSNTDIALANEGQQCFDDLLHDLENEFQPQTSFEQSLIEAMAVARYRQWRIWAIEKASLDHEMRTQAGLWQSSARMEGATPAALAFRSLSDNSRSLDLMNRYEARYERQYFRAHRRLLEVQDRRTPPATQPAPSMPVPVVSQYAPPQPEPNLPATNTEFTERTQEMPESKAAQAEGGSAADRIYRPYFPSVRRIRSPAPPPDDVIPLRNAGTAIVIRPGGRHAAAPT
jgi:hypothetical protein